MLYHFTEEKKRSERGQLKREDELERNEEREG